ncbi:hypothetical protein [Paraconexibacter algicola]|uniref:Uncharacterized protein n=1 Tax=Paraconexibacter algicola TaxID=2133960 RepID=A0A2T4UI51_9ACTN|nr:hypothetical protein [Paraconexibacter algicola]PTL58922.1 hypothetical protein C7Y72_04290 [Paraconexibacter algicola]
MAKPEIRKEARELRAAGHGVRAIARTLGVAQSTVSLWTRDIEATTTAHATRARPTTIARRRLVVWSSGRVRRCSRCATHLPEECFGRTTRGFQGWCRACFRAHARARGPAHREQVARSARRRREVAQAWIRRHLAEHHCRDCGESDLVVLEFDHVDGKSANVGDLVGRGARLDRIIAEAERCEVVCVNCHRNRTATRAGWVRAMPDWRRHLEAKGTRRARNLLHALSHLDGTGCLDCGSRSLVALDFDHRPGTVKRRSVMQLAAGGCALATLQVEIAKCDVRCANCHRRQTMQRGRHFRAQPAPADVPVDLGARRRQARNLRVAGLTIEEIADEVGAARTSVADWVRDLPLTAEQREANLRRRREARIAARLTDEPPRTCRRCGVEQPAAAFSWNSGRRRTTCKACTAARNRVRSDEEKAEAAAKQRERRRRAREAQDREPGAPCA